ncbi:MAG: TetR/AcrR family transcriptional regulator, partial [Dietzia sp.]|nr:TetR/AcrR family transcriptional regulator [Dietzia sp.]
MPTDPPERVQEPVRDPADEAVQDEPNILVPRRRPIQERSRRKFQALL